MVGSAWHEIVVKLGHVPVALGLILSVALMIVGVARNRGSEGSVKGG